MCVCVCVSLVQEYVTRHASGTFYWVGLTDERTGKWEWVNETPYVMNRRCAATLLPLYS